MAYIKVPGRFNRDKFEKILNESVQYSPDNPDFIIGGKPRTGRYGTMLRRHDPHGFYVRYMDWLRENNLVI